MSERGKPKMESVNSANIAAIGYSEQTHTLHVDFHSGSYEFEDVTRDTWENLMRAPSKGKFFHDMIRGKYRERR